MNTYDGAQSLIRSFPSKVGVSIQEDRTHACSTHTRTHTGGSGFLAFAASAMKRSRKLLDKLIALTKRGELLEDEFKTLFKLLEQKRVLNEARQDRRDRRADGLEVEKGYSEDDYDWNSDEMEEAEERWAEEEEELKPIQKKSKK